MILRKARTADAEAMTKLINHYAAQGLMLPRNINSIYQNVRDYILLETDGEIRGIGGLHVFWHDLAEIRSLAISCEMIKQGLGRKIVEYLLDEAKDSPIAMKMP